MEGKAVAQRTIRLYLLFTFFTKFGISFISATYVMFLLSRGLDLFEVNLVNFVFFATLFLCEIPTGAVADVFGRKVSFVISCFLISVGLFLYAAVSSFWGFALAEAIAAVGGTFASGAFQAWLVDMLKHHKHEGSLAKIFAREQQITFGAGILGAITGAFLADSNDAFPWIAGGVVQFIGGVLAWILMREDYFERQPFSFIAGIRAMRETVAVSARWGMRSSVVRFVILIGALQFFAVQAPNMQWQPFFSHFVPNKSSLGFVFSALSLFMMLGSTFSTRFLAFWEGEKRALLVSQIVIGAGIIGTVLLTSFPIALSVFLVHEFARGLFRPLKDVYLNDHIPSKERATLISFESMAHHIGGMVGLVVSGFIAEYVSITAAWVLSGAVLVISGLLLLRNGNTKNQAG